MEKTKYFFKKNDKTQDKIEIKMYNQNHESENNSERITQSTHPP